MIKERNEKRRRKDLHPLKCPTGVVKKAADSCD